MNCEPYSYYYGNETDQYTFYRLPKALFTNDRYKNLSDGAKILYGLMLDRMGLSQKNGWVDGQDRVYIIFTLEDVQEYLNCKHDKGVKILAELDTQKGVGLIERVRRGQGKPAIIYVRKFFEEAGVRTSEKSQSASLQNRSCDFGKTAANDTNINNNKYNNTENHSFLSPTPFPPTTGDDLKPDGGRGKSAFDIYRGIIRENVGYEGLIDRFPYDSECINEIVDLVVETICTAKKTIRVSSEDHPAELVKAKFLRLNSDHVLSVLVALNNNRTEIHNIKQYVLTALFNAPTTNGCLNAAIYARNKAEGLI